MPITRAAASRQKCKHKEETPASSDDDSLRPSHHGHKDVEAEPEMSILDNLRNAMSDVERVYNRCRSLERENKRLKTDLKELDDIAVDGRRTRLRSRETALQRRIQSLEHAIIGLEALSLCSLTGNFMLYHSRCHQAREKDRLTIEKLRDTEVEQEAQALTADQGGATPTRQTSDLGDCAIELLRRMCDTIDMNTLAEAEECAVCMEEMAVEKCYSLPCRHLVCTGCFGRLGDGSNVPSNDRTAVQCPHCRNIYPREDYEIITHTAVQQWDILLEISQQWAAKDVGELGVVEDEDDEDSFTDDDSVANAASIRLPDSPVEAVNLNPEVSTASTPPNDNGPVAYKNLPSPMKREVLTRLAEQRAVKQRV